ncbi:hypothetical protein OG792_14830 [Micromonospora sp. NBC_01699]|uniref:DUF7405 family protein n=1 Tax=Micromonospora sp. NBC_01699 TaxID=2975984 RepID=UPI002E36E4A8|nr:hypothetical protein [Micromonospora sp. NBC_01699]
MGDESRLRRRTMLAGGALAMAASALAACAADARTPIRPAASDPAADLPDIQFDVARFSAPEQSSPTGGPFVTPPVHTVYLTAALGRSPGRDDQRELNRVLTLLESRYAFGAAGLLTFVSYGLPYFRRLPGGLTGDLVGAHLPRLLADPTRSVLEEAVPAPTDVHPDNPGVTKKRFTVPVRIEQNDLLFTFRSDRAAVIQDVLGWFDGSGTLAGTPTPSPDFAGLLTVTSSRHMFTQAGLPRSVAEQNRLPYARFIQPDSPMWMGFSDQQVNASGPPAICTFAGHPSARLTTARPGDYLDNGGIQHVSHVILDMLQFYDMASPDTPPSENGNFSKRVQYMFHAPPVHPGNADQLTDGGGPSFLPADNRGPDYAERTAQGVGLPSGERRMGHLSTLQRSSRAPDGTPMHLRVDGPGFDAMDVPDGSSQPKLHFSLFVPTADVFARMRHSQAAVDLARKHRVAEQDNGLERFLTCTRRQNFLVPPRRHRAFPLVELAD